MNYGFKVFFDLDSNFVNRKSYLIHQDIGSLSVSSSCIVRIPCGLFRSIAMLNPKDETSRVVTCSKTLLCNYVVVISH